MALRKINSRYQTGLFLLITCFTWIITLAFFVLQFTREKEYKIENLNSRLQVLNTEILNELEHSDNFDILDARKTNFSDSIRVSIIDLKGNILYDTETKKPLQNHSNRKEFIDAKNNGEGYMVRRLSESVNQIYFYSATRGDTIIVRTAVPYNESLTQALQIDWGYGYIIIFIAVIINIIAYFATRRIGITVNNLREFAEKAEEGTLEPSVRYEFPQDELGEISSLIVNMYLKEQRIRKERDENTQALVHEVQEKQRIKHQLTNNINHEIKSPVHAIQACLETIVNQGEKLTKEQTVELIHHAYEHVQQLSALLQDISMITRMTDASNKIERTEVNINKILEGIKKEIELYPDEKKMRFNMTVPENMIINGNKHLIESIFQNLTNNALSYSGGRDIFLSASDEGSYYMFEFADNGIGVDKEHLSKLFERFYRVDSGRSRKLGGTGLGLSIVKNAVIFHDGAIKVSNRQKGGLQFTFTLHK